MGQITQSKMVKKSKCIKSTINLTILNFPFKRLCLSTWIKNFSYAPYMGHVWGKQYEKVQNQRMGKESSSKLLLKES